MKLDNNSINQKASEIYMEFSRKTNRTSEWAADIYMDFIKRMKAHQKKNPDKGEVTKGFVKQTIKWIIINLVNKEKNDRKKQELYENIMIQEYEKDYLENHVKPVSEKGCRFFCAFVSENLNTCRNFREYFLYFLLYYSHYIPRNMSMIAALMLGYSLSRFNSWIVEIEEHNQKRIRRYCSRHSTRNRMRYVKIMTGHPADKIDQTFDNKMNRETINTQPSIPMMDHVLGVNHQKIRYGIRKIRTMMEKAYTKKIKNDKSPICF